MKRLETSCQVTLYPVEKVKSIKTVHRGASPPYCGNPMYNFPPDNRSFTLLQPAQYMLGAWFHYSDNKSHQEIPADLFSASTYLLRIPGRSGLMRLVRVCDGLSILDGASLAFQCVTGFHCVLHVRESADRPPTAESQCKTKRRPSSHKHVWW